MLCNIKCVDSTTTETSQPLTLSIIITSRSVLKARWRRITNSNPFFHLLRISYIIMFILSSENNNRDGDSVFTAFPCWWRAAFAHFVAARLDAARVIFAFICFLHTCYLRHTCDYYHHLIGYLHPLGNRWCLLTFLHVILKVLSHPSVPLLFLYRVFRHTTVQFLLFISRFSFRSTQCPCHYLSLFRRYIICCR